MYMEFKENKGFFAYCRESVDLKTGIELQKEKIKKYAEYHNIKIYKWFIENDTSAMKKRKKYNRMMELIIDDNNVEGIICSSISRFGRETTGLLLAHTKLQEHNKRLIFVDNNIDTTNITGKAMMNMMFVYAELERDTINERITAGKKRAHLYGTKSGLPMHRPPIEVDWKEYDKYYNLGLSTNAISKIIKDKRTGKKISSSALYKAVKEREK